MRPDPWAGVTPRRWQAEAHAAVIAALRGGRRRVLVQAATGAGKARLIGSLAAACTGRTLVSAPTQGLVEQLAATVAEHVGPENVGTAFQHAWNLAPRVVVTCLPSLPAVLAERPEWSAWIADEAHRVEGPATRACLPQLQARVAIGVTATPWAANGRGLITWEELVYAYTAYEATRDGVLVPLRIERSPEAGDVDDLVEAWVSRATGPGIITATTVADAEAYAARLGVLAVHGYLGRVEIGRRLEALRVGDVRALVQVQLLVEGFDAPHLRWGALRVPISSPTRLVQFAGRFLRCFPSKTEAVLFDPHDALGAVGLTHGAQLENVARRYGPDPAPDDWEIPELPGLEEVSALPRAAAVSALEGWATDALGVLRAAGVAPLPDPSGVNPAGPWRRNRASDRQRAAAQRWLGASRHLTDPAHRAVVDLLLSQDRLRAGVASDLLGILVAVGRSPRRAARVQLPLVAARVTA